MNMLLYLLFATAVAAECDTGTCLTCKTMPGCDWYGWACYNSSGAAKTLNIPATAMCEACQAGNCTDCEMQNGCSWYKSNFGLPGKCATNATGQTGYTMLDVCPPCDNYMSCDDCSKANETCGWYQLGKEGKCREAAPSFLWTKIQTGYCSGDPCASENTCKECQNVTGSICAWYESKNPAFYSSKCDSAEQGSLDTAFYNKIATGACPACAGTTCTDCKKDPDCKWAAVDAGVFGSSFGQCVRTVDGTPFGKEIISICPATCDLHSCNACKENPACHWYTKNAVRDASCDLASDAAIHIGQSPATQCLDCDADRCYECNKLPNCGWYVNKVLGIGPEGCYSKLSPPSGRTLWDNSNPKCKGVPGSSAHVTFSIVVLAVLALVA